MISVLEPRLKTEENRAKKMNCATQEDWRKRYLPLVVELLPDSTVYYPWLRFSLANI